MTLEELAVLVRTRDALYQIGVDYAGRDNSGMVQWVQEAVDYADALIRRAGAPLVGVKLAAPQAAPEPPSKPYGGDPAEPRDDSDRHAGPEPAGPAWCCEEGQRLNVYMCPDCDETTRAYSAAMGPEPAPELPPPSTWAEQYLREKYGAHRAHYEWRALTEAFNAGLAAQPAFDAIAVPPLPKPDHVMPAEYEDPETNWYRQRSVEQIQRDAHAAGLAAKRAPDASRPRCA